MAAADAPTNPNAVAPWQGTRDLSSMAEAFPESKVIRLFKVDQIRQYDPHHVPQIELMRISTNEDDREVYHESQSPANHVSLTKIALRHLRDLADITTISSRRLDDGKDPDVCEWQVWMERPNPIPGRLPLRAPGTKQIDLHQLGAGKTPQWLAKEREHLVRKAESKAMNAALRDLLGLQHSYPKSVLAGKPFAVLRWVPDMTDPEVRARSLDRMFPAITAAYGPGAARLGAGDQAAYEIAPHLPDEDDDADDKVHEGRFVEVATNGTATVDKATGEIMAERPGARPGVGTPDWFGAADDAGPLDFGEGATAAQPSLAQRLQAIAGQHADSTDRPTGDQQEAVKVLLTPVGKSAFTRGMHAAFDIGPVNGQQCHAFAILEVAQAMGADAFREAWVAMAAGS